jgi:hypothetical protein
MIQFFAVKIGQRPLCEAWGLNLGYFVEASPFLGV